MNVNGGDHIMLDRRRIWSGLVVGALAAALVLAVPSTARAVPTADTTPPGPVTAVQATVTTSAFGLSWRNPMDADFGGVMIRRAVGPTPPTATTGTLVTTTAKSATSFTDSHLAKATQYSYALFARDTAGNYATRAVKTSSTTTPATCRRTAAQLTNAAAIAVQVLVFDAAGQPAPAGAAGGYEVDVLTTPNDTPTGLLTTDANGFAVTAPLFATSAGTLYNIEVGSEIAGVAVVPGECLLSEYATTDTTAPTPVTRVVATVTTSAVGLSWTNPAASDFDGVMIRRAVGSVAPTSTSGTLVTTTAPGATAFTDSHLAAGTQYTYALFARDYLPNYAAAVTKTVTMTTPATCRTTAAQLGSRGAIAVRVAVFDANDQPVASAAAGVGIDVLAEPSDAPTGILTTDASGFAVTAALPAAAAGTQYFVQREENSPTVFVYGTRNVSLVPGECVLAELAASTR